MPLHGDTLSKSESLSPSIEFASQTLTLLCPFLDFLFPSVNLTPDLSLSAPWALCMLTGDLPVPPAFDLECKPCFHL